MSATPDEELPSEKPGYNWPLILLFLWVGGGLGSILYYARLYHTSLYRFDVLPAVQDAHWYKGNIHTHSTRSDGDSSPETVARWYRHHGYDFLAITDHNNLTTEDNVKSVTGRGFLYISGEELTQGVRRAPVHVNGLGIPGTLLPVLMDDVGEALQANVDAIRAVGGVPIINHPNYKGFIGPSLLSQVKHFRLLDIYNGALDRRNKGRGAIPPVETTWDQLLTKGMVIYGVAVDDAHHFLPTPGPARAAPGRAWVWVRAARLESNAILRALELGQFYSSSGVTLEDVEIDHHQIRVFIREEQDTTYVTEFIGSNGRVLKEVAGLSASYTLGQRESYVRARVTDSNGAMAWVQPVFVKLPSL